MELVKPEIGLIFWQLISFSVVLFILGKFAWKPILQLLHDRESSIESALNAAEEAKSEMTMLKSENEKILAQANREKDEILADARKIKDQIISEARKQATEEADKLIIVAKQLIEAEKTAAVKEIKSAVASLSVSVAEKILKSELKDASKYNDYVSQSLDEFKLN
jgi:F-type H+-transporting ATPase subunit b